MRHAPFGSNLAGRMRASKLESSSKAVFSWAASVLVGIADSRTQSRNSYLMIGDVVVAATMTPLLEPPVYVAFTR